jgi:rod shape determining protein RodA
LLSAIIEPGQNYSQKLRRVAGRFDWSLLLAALVLAAIGIVFIWSASHGGASAGGFASGYFKRQVVWLGVALVGFLAAVIPHYLVFVKLGYTLYVLGLLLVGLTLVVGVGPGSVRRFLSIAGQRVHPGEFAKLALIVCLARYVMYRDNYRKLFGLIVPLVLTLLPMAAVILQPDLGSALVFLPILFVVLYVAGARPKHLGLVIALGLASLPIFYFHLLRPYQQVRLKAFINPQAYARDYGGYHLLQSLNAVGSGGFWGQGLGQGNVSQLGFLPTPHTDFIFAVIAEEWGFIGAVFMLGLYLFIFMKGLAIAWHTREPFGRLLAVGIVALFASHVFINTAMTVQLMPITGLALPFVSYGGSSLLASLIGLGLLVNVDMRRVDVLADEDFK